MYPERILSGEIQVRKPCAAKGRSCHCKQAFLYHGGIGQAERPLYGARYRFGGLVGHMQIGAEIHGPGQGVDVRLLVDLAVFRTGEKDRCKHAFLGILQGLPVAVIIYAGPGSHRPDVI